MGTETGKRRALIIALGVCVLLLFLGLAALNAFNPSYMNPRSSLQALGFIILSTVAFLLFVVVLVLLVRNVLKLYADQRSRILGTRLRTRMLWGAVLVSIVPLVFMYAFSYLLMNRAMERWFSQPVAQMREQSDDMATDLARYIGSNARSEADSVALGLADSSRPVTATAAKRELYRHEVTLQGGFAIVYRDNRPVASFHVPQADNRVGQLKAPESENRSSDENASDQIPIETVPLSGPVQSAILQAAQRNDGSIYSLNGIDYILATAPLKHGGIVVAGLPIPERIATATQNVRQADKAYQTLFRERRQVRSLYMVLLSLVTVLALFACCWLALNLSKQVTQPVESLADAMEAIAAGNYGHRVGESATNELGELVESFNAMATDLESARSIADKSTAQLSDLNDALLARRTELETIIETIPNGVVTLSPDRRILIANRAFSETLDPGGEKQYIGLLLSEAFAPEIAESLERLLQRSHRMGSASAEMQTTSALGELQLAATAAVLESSSSGENHHLGYVLVLEDITQLLRAQKQNAWKEVARRVAHEIKNPLTPISLNAELIQRHVSRLTPVLLENNIESRSPAVIQRSSEVITASVETLRSLVDQFSALAEFPNARPKPADLNQIVQNAVSLFTGRLGTIRVVCTLANELPMVFADAVALKRALSNLIDNAAEAMQDSLLRELHITTQMPDSGIVELIVADTGPGVTDDMRERLFLPYFSTKQRGTGLGLSIAAKIVQEHHGTIRVEKNLPAGARFIIELKPASEPVETPAFTAPEPMTATL